MQFGSKLQVRRPGRAAQARAQARSARSAAEARVHLEAGSLVRSVKTKTRGLYTLARCGTGSGAWRVSCMGV